MKESDALPTVDPSGTTVRRHRPPYQGRFGQRTLVIFAGFGYIPGTDDEKKESPSWPIPKPGDWSVPKPSEKKPR